MRDATRYPLLYARALFTLVATLATATACAGFVTISQADLTTIFAQASVGVVINPAVTVSAPDLRVIDNEDQLNKLFALGMSDVPVIDAFFVDAINECGGEILPPAIGCGQQGGNKLTVESDFSAQPKAPGAAVSPGSILLAHEIGHNLGLPHLGPPPDNLLNPSLSDNFDLTPDQIAIIRNSPLVQTQNDQKFITITPFAIVPEPASLLFALAGAISLLTPGLRRRSA